MNTIKPKLYLCKPNKTVIGSLIEAFDIQQNTRLANVNELQFTIPFEIDTFEIDTVEDIAKNKMIKNPNIDKMKQRYLVKMVKGNKTEWYRIEKITDSMLEDRDVRTVRLFSLPIELNDNSLRGYSAVSKHAEEVLTDILAPTLWRIDYIEADFLLTYRTFDFPNHTILDAVLNVATTFNAIILWDTVNRKISLYKPENIGVNKGLSVGYGKLMKSVRKEDENEEFCTRLKVFGRDGLSIQRLNLGSNHLEDFSYFLFPFQRDEFGFVIQSSDYMSDSLCHAILDHQALVETKRDEVTTLIANKEIKQEELTIKENELTTLETELAIILDQLDVAFANGDDTTQLIADRDAKQVEIDNKLAEIDTINDDIASIDQQMTDIQVELSVEINFTLEQIEERQSYIIEKTWEDQNYIDDQTLYDDAVKKFEEIRTPKVVVNIDIVNLLEIVEESHNHEKLNLGDIINIRHDKLSINIQAKIIEINYDYERGNISLVIANAKEVIDNDTKFVKGLYKSMSTSNTVDLNKFKWDSTETNRGEIDWIIEILKGEIKNELNLAFNETVTVNQRGITIADATDPLKFLRATHGILGITSNGGNSFDHAITWKGIVADRLYGKVILSNILHVGDENGILTLLGDKLTIKDNLENERATLGQYEVGKYGLKLLSKDGNQTLISEDGLMQTWQEGRTDNVDGSNGLVLNVFIPSKTISMAETILRFKLLPFRSYSQTSASGGASTETSAQSGAVDFWTDENMYKFIAGFTGDSTGSDGSHSHSASSGTTGSHVHGGQTSGVLGNTDPVNHHYHDYRYMSSAGDHSHSVSVDSAGSHSHPLYNHGHRITIGSHVHSLDLPSHSHSIVHGIYTSTSATNVTVKINGTDRTTALGGSFTTDQNNLDLTQYMVIGQWNTIELGSSQLGRIDSSIFVQAMIGVG